VDHDQHPAGDALVEIFFHLDPIDQGGPADTEQTLP
jgi:hypothetical protein